MAEKIINGGFTTNLANWSNIGAYAFFHYSQSAYGESGLYDNAWHQHKLVQYFSISSAVQVAVLYVSIFWDLYHRAEGDGEVVFYAKITKPDSTVVELAAGAEDASGGDTNGWDALCDGLNIAAHLNQIGTYRFELWMSIKSAWFVIGETPVYVQSFGAFDAISLAVTERESKTVLEVLGGGEAPQVGVGLSQLEGAALSEVLDHEGAEPGTATRTQKCGIKEFLAAAVAVAKGAAAGLVESLERTYNYRKRDMGSNTAGYEEFLSARYQVGNVTIEKELAGELVDIWTRIDPAETYWEPA